MASTCRAPRCRALTGNHISSSHPANCEIFSKRSEEGPIIILTLPGSPREWKLCRWGAVTREGEEDGADDVCRLYAAGQEIKRAIPLILHLGCCLRGFSRDNVVPRLICSHNCCVPLNTDRKTFITHDQNRAEMILYAGSCVLN